MTHCTMIAIVLCILPTIQSIMIEPSTLMRGITSSHSFEGWCVITSEVKIHTSQNLADMLTKVVTTEKLKTCSASAGLIGNIRSESTNVIMS